MTTCVLIGGAADGRRVDVTSDELPKELRVPVLLPRPQCAEWSQSALPGTSPIYGKESYDRVTIYSPLSKSIYYVHRSIPDPVQRLIDKYTEEAERADPQSEEAT